MYELTIKQKWEKFICRFDCFDMASCIAKLILDHALADEDGNEVECTLRKVGETNE